MTGVLKMNTIASEQRILNNKLRRKRQLRRRKKAGALILLTAIFFFSAFFSLRIRAEGSHDCEAFSKYYTSIQVKSGDTLWRYARQYGNNQYYRSSMEYVEEVMTINSLTDDNITTGQYLILPYYQPVSPNADAMAKNGFVIKTPSA